MVLKQKCIGMKLYFKIKCCGINYKMSGIAKYWNTSWIYLYEYSVYLFYFYNPSPTRYIRINVLPAFPCFCTKKNFESLCFFTRHLNKIYRNYINFHNRNSRLQFIVVSYPCIFYKICSMLYKILYCRLMSDICYILCFVLWNWS